MKIDYDKILTEASKIKITPPSNHVAWCTQIISFAFGVLWTVTVIVFNPDSQTKIPSNMVMAIMFFLIAFIGRLVWQRDRAFYTIKKLLENREFGGGKKSGDT